MTRQQEWADCFSARPPEGFVIVPGAVQGADGKRYFVHAAELWSHYQVRPLLARQAPHVLVLPGCFHYEPEPNWWLWHELPRARILWPDHVPLTPRPDGDYDLMAAVMRWARDRRAGALRRLSWLQCDLLRHQTFLERRVASLADRIDAFEVRSRHGRFA